MPDEATPSAVVDAARRHIALFNACVDSGDWTPFVATYHADAVLEIEGADIPVIRGRDAIGAFYASRPPQDHMQAEAISTTGEDTTQVDFAWDSGARGRLIAQWDGQVVRHVRLSPRH